MYNMTIEMCVRGDSSLVSRPSSIDISFIFTSVFFCGRNLIALNNMLGKMKRTSTVTVYNNDRLYCILVVVGLMILTTTSSAAFHIIHHHQIIPNHAYHQIIGSELRTNIRKDDIRTTTYRTISSDHALSKTSEGKFRSPFGLFYSQSSRYRSSLLSSLSDNTNGAVVVTTTTPANGIDLSDNNNNIVAKEGGRGVISTSQQASDLGLTLGAPPVRPKGGHYLTKGGIQVTAHVTKLLYTGTDTQQQSQQSQQSQSQQSTKTSTGAIEELIDLLDSHKGVLLTSSYEFPGRYARWSIGFVDPPIQITGRPGGICIIESLNERGMILMPAIYKSIKQLLNDNILSNIEIDIPDAVVTTTNTNNNEEEVVPHTIRAYVVPPSQLGTFSEEDRSKQPSLFSIIRSLVNLFTYEGNERQLGLYGTFGYDLTFAFEPIDLKQSRDINQRDLILYLPDQIVVVDQDKHDSWIVSYDFYVNNKSTQGLSRTGTVDPFRPYNHVMNHNNNNNHLPFEERDTPKNMFANSVIKAKHEFAVGNLFETVLSQTFREKLNEKIPPSKLFRRLRQRNPAPYGFLINIGEQEYLIGASPEMFVRCETIIDNPYERPAIRVETCPISGTVARGANALEDAQRVKSLMMNVKEESELTMCTDVDRNDKSRICEPGSVQVIGRRQIEMYSRLIHTVDHVEGYLRSNFDALDAFLCHTWAVTVTGAPKTWAIQFIEDTEQSPRCWYGGAVGMIGFDGSLNTGLTLRTVRVINGIAEVRAGATLLYDSIPEAEELETELKASAMLDAIRHDDDDNNDIDIDVTNMMKQQKKKNQMVGEGMNIILIDHEDSFVHTLGNYLRQTGATVTTLRSGPLALQQIETGILNDKNHKKPDLLVLSPGPGSPTDFGLSNTIDLCIKYEIPIFGVCLGLQGMVEHFGGKLGILNYPMHGKPSLISLMDNNYSTEKSIFQNLPKTFEVARYHSLHGMVEHMPDCLEVTATSNHDNIVMGIQHKTLPIAGVQFHPESILTSPIHGMTILQNALTVLKYKTNTNDVSTTSSNIIMEDVVDDSNESYGTELVVK